MSAPEELRDLGFADTDAAREQMLIVRGRLTDRAKRLAQAVQTNCSSVTPIAQGAVALNLRKLNRRRRASFDKCIDGCSVRKREELHCENMIFDGAEPRFDIRHTNPPVGLDDCRMTEAPGASSSGRGGDS